MLVLFPDSKTLSINVMVIYGNDSLVIGLVPVLDMMTGQVMLC